MIGYAMYGTNDLEKAVAFYDALLGAMGAGRFMEGDRFVAWGTGMDKPGFAVCEPADGQAASIGNGTMIALAADSKDTVDAIYEKALELGGTDEGKPGYRGDPKQGFYAGYFRDLDGNKLNVFCMSPE